MDKAEYVFEKIAAKGPSLHATKVLLKHLRGQGIKVLKKPGKNPHTFDPIVSIQISSRENMPPRRALFEQSRELRQFLKAKGHVPGDWIPGPGPDGGRYFK